MLEAQDPATRLSGIRSMNVGELAVLPAATLANLKSEVEQVLEEAQRLDDKLDAALDYRYGPRARQARAALEKDTGTVRFEDNGFVVVADLPKRVKWDQQRLKEVVELIRAGWGEDPADYVKIRFEVSERAYEAWPARLRELFGGARTVETGRPSYHLLPPDHGRRL
ncbi:hypothetical protein [Aestuariivirga sp.]|uniref:hypothetical protein n=1 Tax=Aestuariivirga sp. TaxID=2650926 RepID=UPI003918CBFE